MTTLSMAMPITANGIGQYGLCNGIANSIEAVEYAQEPGTVRTQFDQEKTPAQSMAVIATLADQNT